MDTAVDEMTAIVVELHRELTEGVACDSCGLAEQTPPVGDWNGRCEVCGTVMA